MILSWFGASAVCMLLAVGTMVAMHDWPFWLAGMPFGAGEIAFMVVDARQRDKRRHGIGMVAQL
jgi:hypothetical protein